ncbi:MAG: tetratricopeptide repeat protein [Thermodesulfobacteriota bacterium]|nr:tetratricopeptide repeat protein [Thermodesulfobacteriota bacterium]
MSLIHDYLKTIRERVLLHEPTGAVPPVLLHSDRKRSGKIFIMAGSVVLLCVIYFLIHPVDLGTLIAFTPPRTLPAIRKPSDVPETKTDETIVEQTFQAGPGKSEIASTQSKDESYILTGRTLFQNTDSVSSLKKNLKQEPAGSQNRVKPKDSAASNVNHTSGYFQAGLIAQQFEDLPAAENYYLMALKESPSDLKALINLSAVYIQRKKNNQAEKILKRILKISPANSKAHINLGVIDLSRKKYDNAASHFEAALALDPDEESALINLALLAQRDNDLKKVENCYRQLLELQPKNPEILLAYGSLLEQESRVLEAVTCYAESLTLEIVKNDHQLSSRIKNRISLLQRQGRVE